MTDKVQKIREKVVEIVNSINPFIPDEDGKNSDYEVGRFAMATQILQIIDSLEEPARRTSADIESTMQEVEEKSKAFTEAHKGKSSNEILAQMRGEEPISIDFEQELYKAFGQVKDFTLGMRIAKWFYDMGNNSQEPVSDELNEAAIDYAESVDYRGFSNAPWNFVQDVFKAGAKWQITKLMKDATEVTVHIDAGGYPYTPEIELYDYDKDIPLAKEGDKYKVVLIKEE